MNKVKKEMIEGIYFDWCARQESTNKDEEKAWTELQSYLPDLSSANCIGYVDAISGYGATMERLGFVVGFETAVKLLIGGEVNE